MKRIYYPILLVLALCAPPLGRAQPIKPAPASTASPSTKTNAPATEAKPTASTAPLPAAQEVLNRFVKEIGGEAAFAKINSQHLTGKCEMGAQGITGNLEVFAKRPDKLVIKISLPAIGDLIQGFDGKVGWSLNPVTGPMVLDGKMLDQLREQARFDSVLHERDEYKSMKTLGKEPFEGKDCYKLKLVHKSGQETTEYYETESGMLIGSTEVQETPLGAISVTAIIGEYKKFGDILFATKLTQKMGPLAQVMSFENMEFNQVDDSAFELPAQIKGLLKK